MTEVAGVGLAADVRAALAEVAAELLPGETAYLVGGSVRDLLFGRETRDLDLVVVGRAVDLARRLGDRLGGAPLVHAAFETAELRVGGLRLDFAGARRERYPAPAALPVVEPADLREDLARRDFSVNAMALPLAAASWDELVDPHGGRQALAERRLSVLHDRSFRDDPTRILRGVELGARLGLRFDAGTEALARADGVFFEALSPSRLAEAWARLFPDTQALGAKLTALGALGLGWLLGGGFEGLQAKDVARLEAALAGPDGPRGIVERAVLAWLARRGGAAVEHALARRFGRPQLVGLGERLDEAAAALTLDLPPHLLEAAVAGLGEIELVVLAATAEQRAADRAELVRGQWRRLRLAIAGADLLAAGWPAGPRIGEALRRTRRARLDGEIEQSEELKFALAWLQGGEGSG